MALKQVRIGALEDVFQYDDGDYPKAISVDDPIEQTVAPAGANDLVRQTDIPTLGDIVSSSANIADNKAVRGDGGAKGIQASDVTIKDGGDVSIPTGKGYQVNDIQVVTDQQAAEADLAAVPDLTGADTIDQSGLETYLGDIRTKLNNLLAKLRTHGLIDT